MNKLESLTPGETIDVKMGTEKEKYQIGDPFEMRFMVSQESYIILMDISTNGDITFIAPSVKVPDSTIEKERVYSTLHDFGLNITVAPPIGVETINLFCSAEKLALFEVDLKKEPFYTIASDDEERLKKLLASLEELEKSEWSGNSVSFLIEDPQKGGTRGQFSKRGGVLPAIGTTGTTGKFFPPIGTTGTTGKALPAIGTTGTTGHSEEDTPKDKTRE